MAVRLSRLPMAPYYQPMGALVTTFNVLEKELTEAIVHLVRTAETTTALLTLTHINSFDARIDLFSQLAHWRLKDEGARARVRRLVKRLENANRRRNDLVHGAWKSYAPNAHILRFQIQAREPKFRYVEASPQRVRADAEKNYRLAQALSRFVIVIDAQNSIDARRERGYRETQASWRGLRRRFPPPLRAMLDRMIRGQSPLPPRSSRDSGRSQKKKKET